MSNLMRTIVLKIYKPSKRKKYIMDEAMLNYSRAFQYLLDRAYVDIENIKESYKDKNGAYRAELIAKWIDKKLSMELNRFNIEPFKDSIKIDFASTISEYLNFKAKGIDVKYPCSYIDKEKAEKQYDKLISRCEGGSITYYELEHKIDKLMNKADKLRAIYFCRYSTSRNYSLLYDHESDRYYAKIYLMNVRNDKRKLLESSSDKTLIYIDKDKEIFNEKTSKKSFLLLPLAFGKWQYGFIKKAESNPHILRTARLVKRKDEYYLSINMLIESASPVETENYMGICRGIENVLNYSVVDKEENILDEGSINLENIERSAIHKVANTIVNTAAEKGCTIVMEKFLSGGDGINFEGYKDKKPLIGYSDYNELFKIIKYKAHEKGLPPPIRVSSFGIFYTCPHCGVNSKANRFSWKMMICTQCGTTMDIEKLGSLNISKKLLKYNKDAIKVKAVNTKEGIKFINEELDLEFYPKDPFDCAAEFLEKIQEMIKKFYDKISLESQKLNFKRKYSLIKKLEQHKEMLEIIKIE